MNILLMLAMIFGSGAPPAAVSSGIASWYADAKMPQGSLYAAVPGYRGRPYYAYVRKGTHRVRVLVADSCGCPGGRVIDLSWRAFSDPYVGLGVALSRGLTNVIVERP